MKNLFLSVILLLSTLSLSAQRLFSDYATFFHTLAVFDDNKQEYLAPKYLRQSFAFVYEPDKDEQWLVVKGEAPNEFESFNLVLSAEYKSTDSGGELHKLQLFNYTRKEATEMVIRIKDSEVITFYKADIKNGLLYIVSNDVFKSKADAPW